MRRIPGTLAAVVLLALPARAAGAIITVDPSATAGCTGAVCRTLSDAAASAQSGDTITLMPGTYQGPVSFTQNDLTILSSGPLSAIVTASGAAPAISLNGDRARLAGLAVFATGNGSAVRFNGGGTAFAPNRLDRSVMVGANGGGPAVEVRSGSTSSAAKNLVIQSSIITAGTVGLLAQTDPSGPSVLTAPSSAGDITIGLDHVTMASPVAGFKGIVANANANGDSPPAPLPLLLPMLKDCTPTQSRGNITVTASRSIMRGGSFTSHFAGTSTPLVTACGNASTVAAGATNDFTTPDSRLFVDSVNRNYHLRVDAPGVLDRFDDSSSAGATDIDGDPRVLDAPGAAGGALSDIGADELLNRAPSATLAGPGAGKQRQTLTFDASGSKDPETAYGGGIVGYAWDFGDGTKVATTSPTNSHAFPNEGNYNVIVTAVDRQGQASPASAPVAVHVTDGAAPALSIDSPKRGQRIRRGTRRLIVRGTASDENGVREIRIAMQLNKRIAEPRHPKPAPNPKPKPTTSAHTSAARCTWFTGRKGFVRRPCNSPLWFRVTLRDTRWSYITPPGYRVALGNYTLRVRATDLAGNTTARASATDRTLVPFTLLP